MGEIYFEGFTQYPDISTAGVGLISTWLNSGGVRNSMFTAGPLGSRAFRPLRDLSGTSMYDWAIPAHQTGNMGVRIKLDQVVTSSRNAKPLRLLSAAGDEQLAFSFDSAGRAQVLCGANVLYTSTRMLVPAAWHHIALQYVIDPLVGKLRMFIDGEDQGELTGLDTQNSATDLDIGQVRIYYQSSATSTVVGGQQYTDFYVVPDEYESIGECAVYEILADASILAQFVPSGAGTNNEMIDESACDGDTTYNSSNTVGQRDVFSLADLTVIPNEIFAIEVLFAGRKDDAATRTVNILANDGTADIGTKEMFLSTTHLFDRLRMRFNPTTGVEWTQAELDALQVGYELTL